MYKLIIVDDNINDRNGISGLISWHNEGIEVAGIASNGKQGLELAIKTRPDFVITDVSMPLMNGIEMTEKIKKELPGTYFIFISCYDDVEYLQSAINLEISAYVLKPINLEELLESVRKIKKVKEKNDSEILHLAELEVFVEKSLPLLQMQYIKELLYGVAEKSNLAEQAAYYKLDFSCTTFCVFCAQIDGYRLRYGHLPAERKHLLINQTVQLINRHLFSVLKGYSANVDNDKVIGIIKSNDTCTTLNTELIIEEVSKCIEMINKDLELEITFGISNYESDFTYASQKFQEAEYAVRSKFYSKGNRIIFFSEVDEPGMHREYIKSTLVQQLNTFLAEENPSDIEQQIREALSGAGKQSPDQVRGMAYSLVGALQLVLLDSGIPISDIFGNDNQVWEKISFFDTMDDLCTFLVDLFNNAHNIFHSSRKAVSIVNDIINVIDNNYPYIENINQIIDGLYINNSTDFI